MQALQREAEFLSKAQNERLAALLREQSNATPALTAPMQVLNVQYSCL